MCLVFIIVGIILIALPIVTVTVFLILMLIGIRKAAIEFESAIKRISSKFNVFDKISAKVASMDRKSSSLVISWISFLYLCFFKHQQKKKNKIHKGVK
jgi:uncharacterized membrane protein YbaN (DUF454 family)